MTLRAPDVSMSLLVAFCRTVEEGSFTGAARALGLRPAAVSRAIARLEAVLGVPLFKRSTRQLRVTPAAERYYADVRAALVALADAEANVLGRAVARGRVRLSVPSTWGLHVLLPSLSSLREALPEIELDVQVGNDVVDFHRQGFDMAVRLGRIEDASLVARKLGVGVVGLFASPDYLAKHGRPRSLEDLARHTLLPFVLPRSGRTLPWIFANPDEEMVPRSAVRVLDDPQGVIALARGHVGICQSYHFMVAREIADQSLVEVLRSRGGRTRVFSLVYPKQGLSPAARAVVNFIVERRA